MTITLIFWFCLFLLVYTYVLYPLLVHLLSIQKRQESPELTSYPKVFVILAAHNEESVIIDKLDSINKSNYPEDKVFLFIGSDNSTDKTNTLVENYISGSKYAIHFYVMPTRSGKIGTMNFLVNKIQSEHQITESDVFISTDANVMFDQNTIPNLTRHFKNPKIGIVDTRILNPNSKSFEVTKSESHYLSNETMLKHREGLVFGKLMGAFGGCFAIRATCFTPIPSNLRVDDFFLCMSSMVKGYSAISDLEAICYEDNAATFKEEFKRKRRISSGNFQNMSIFKAYLLPFSTLGFVFFSHKVIRYIGPILMIIILLTNLYLAFTGQVIMIILLIAQATWYILIPLLDKMCQLLGINVLALRHVRYFNHMNFALLYGLKDYINGINSNIWEPTKRI